MTMASAFTYKARGLGLRIHLQPISGAGRASKGVGGDEYENHICLNS
jgi:hypothetical protein